MRVFDNGAMLPRFFFDRQRKATERENRATRRAMARRERRAR
jgi:hypothetical protein